MVNGKTTFPQTSTLPDGFARVGHRAFVVGLVALGLCVLIGLFGWRQFLASYLVAYSLGLGVTLGSMGILMLHHLTGGRWGYPIRAILEAITRNMPLMTVLFLPLLLGVHRLYSWSHPDIVARDELLQHKQAYLNVGFFILRACLYFAVWNGMAFALNRWSRELERTRSVAVARRMQILSGPGILLYVFSMSFAAFDWLMSLEPHWYSTIFGMLTVTGQVLGAFATVILFLAWTSKYRPVSDVISPGHFHDVGNLTLAFVMLWAYMSLSQFLIIWSGDIATEVPWYVVRTNNGWGFVALLIVVFHFAVPFVLLLSRRVKREPNFLAKVAAMILFMRWVDLFWWTAPALHRDGFHLSLMDLLAPVGVGGLWLAGVIRQLGRRPLLPIGEDMETEERLAAEGS